MINNMQAEITQLTQKCMSQNRTQTNITQSIKQEITSMKGEITQLTEKCEHMEASIDSRFDGVDEKLKYHDILLQNQHWKYSAKQNHRPNEQAGSFLKQNEMY